MNGTNLAEGRMIGALLRIPAQYINERIYRAFHERGFDDLRPAHFAVFQHLPSTTTARVTELAERAQMTKQSMGYLIEYLEEHGYVELGSDPRDRRAKLIRLTERGEAVERIAISVIREIEAEWQSLIGQEQWSNFRHILERLAGNMEQPIV